MLTWSHLEDDVNVQRFNDLATKATFLIPLVRKIVTSMGEAVG